VTTPAIVILSEDKARSYEPAGVEVCISIINPKGTSPRLSKRFRAILRLAFSDIAAPSPFPWDSLFNEEHAREILRFLAEWREADRIVIHCMAGQSRSPAVAMGIHELVGQPVETLEETYPLWNTWVRSELVRVGRKAKEGGCGFRFEWP
jgi:predicted protein tyrosine phosphatase